MVFSVARADGPQPRGVVLKTSDDIASVANMVDYESACEGFRWEYARAELDGLPGGRGLNIAHEAVDRHANGPLRDKLALRWLGRRGERRDFSYGELAGQSARFANALAKLGVLPGKTVVTLLGRIPELYVAALGSLRSKAVFCPLFSVFGPEPIETRLRLGDAQVLVTTPRLYQRKIQDIRARLPALQHVILVGPDSETTADASCHRWDALMEAVGASHRIPDTNAEDPALLHFTSGTTGTPKGVLHVHEAVVMHHITGKLVLDLHRNDIYWCTADPGWVTGTSYGIIAPLTLGVTMIVDEAEFDVERWYQTLEEERVNVWYTAPTAIRMLMKRGMAPIEERDLSALRFMASVGEPLNPEAVVWSRDAFGIPFHDNWWQTETGGIMIANYACMDVKPGSMGKPVPGVEVALVKRTSDREGSNAKIEVLVEPNLEGELALRPGWPSMMRGYLHSPQRYAKCFEDGWYLSGDLARRDADGYYWFVGRADDVIKSAGHLIGPFEVESALMEHEAVAEAGIIGKPDEVAGMVVKAFVSLKDGFVDSTKLQRSLMAHARRRLGPAVAPREIEVVDSLPKTRSGKIMRRLLKAHELGLSEGDTSTLEGSETEDSSWTSRGNMH